MRDFSPPTTTGQRAFLDGFAGGCCSSIIYIAIASYFHIEARCARAASGLHAEAATSARGGIFDMPMANADGIRLLLPRGQEAFVSFFDILLPRLRKYRL